ncbi:MAG: phosphoglycerate mutase family protein [Chitinophagaceae bacterium]
MLKILLSFLLMSVQYVFAQQNTFILIRHAEKDTTVQGSTTMNANPPLSKQGLKRAIKLVKALKKFTVDEIYSTDFTRTKTTVEPLSVKKEIEVKIYNHKQLKEFAKELVAKQNKIIVIAGHSNSTPALVNLIIKKETYPALDESVYNKIYIVTQNGNDFSVEVREY